VKTVNMQETKAHLSRLVDEVRTGQEAEVVIALSGMPVARLVPYGTLRKRPLGLDVGLFRAPKEVHAAPPFGALI
jgi:prevent-host-death family protein